MKYRPDPHGPWVTVTLGHDPRLLSGDPKKPPEDLQARAAEFCDIEYRAKHGLIRAAPQAQSLREFADAYMAAYPESHDDGSVLLVNRNVKDFVAWCTRHGLTTLQSVTEAHCKDYLNFRKKSIAGTTLRTTRSYISGMFSRAVDEKKLVVNPFAKARLGKRAKPKKKPRFWTSEEVARIVAACRLPWHKDLVIVLANTGIRISGTLAMEWGWIDWKEATINVPAGHNKGDTDYSVTMSGAVHDILARRYAASKSKYVFAREETGEPYGYDGASAMIGRAVAKAGVPRGTAHDLRHTFGRWLHLKGVPQAVISAMLGHASLSTTEIYIKLDQDSSTKIMRRLALGLDRDGPGADGTASPPASAPS